MYKNYIFDLYGTLIDLDVNERKEEFWQKLALFFSCNGAYYEKEELRQTYMKLVSAKFEMRLEKTEYPDVKLIKIFKKAYKEKNVKADDKLLRQTMRVFRVLSTESIKVYDGVIETLESLQEQGKYVYILSNGQREFSIDELKYLGIYKYFDGIFFSSDYGVCKPDSKFYKKLIKEASIDEKESLVIGNSYATDIETANELGIDTVYIHTNLSPLLTGEIDANFTIMDGDIKKILDFKKEEIEDVLEDQEDQNENDTAEEINE